MRKSLKLSLVSLSAISILAAGLAGCGTSSATSITVCLASEPGSIDPALNTTVDGSTYIVHAFSGLYGYKEVNGVATVSPACATGYTLVANADGTSTYKFTLRSDLKWSDGTSLNADDFVYSWNRAASGKLASDYGYMFEVIENGVNVENDATGTEKLGIESVNSGAELDVTVPVVVPYFLELMAFPTYAPVKQSVVEAADLGSDGTWTNGKWATDPTTYVTNGPYKMKSWTHNSEIVFEKNPYYYDASSIGFNEIHFALSDDSSNMYANFQTGAYDMIDDMPLAELSAIKTAYPTEFFNDEQLGTYYLSFNMNSTSMNAIADTEEKREKTRTALSLLLDRNYICDSVAKGGQTPANGFVAKALSDPAGGKYTDHNGVNGDGKGYYSVAAADFASNTATAVQELKDVGFAYDDSAKKFTNFPSISYIYNTSDSHKAIAEYVQSAFAAYGINMQLQNSDWATFVSTRKSGSGYDLARNGWLADYNDPISFLDMWTSGSGNDDIQAGKGDNKDYAGYSFDLNNDGTIGTGETGLTWAQSYDVAIANIKASSVSTTRYSIMHKAETLLMSTGAIVPIYNYTDQYLISDKISGFFASPLGYKFFMYASKAV